MRKFIATAVMAFGLATGASAAPIDVGFRFSDGVDTVEGILVFDDFGDKTANSISFTSDVFGEKDVT